MANIIEILRKGEHWLDQVEYRVQLQGIELNRSTVSSRGVAALMAELEEDEVDLCKYIIKLGETWSSRGGNHGWRR
jgi:hypothetical protein